MNNTISVITINYNNDAGLQRTVESVLGQEKCSFEYLIIDGGSTDTSVALIKSHAARLAYWVSEPDKGVYDAMNKGIAKATGEYLIFLNSGDILSRADTLRRCRERLDNYPLIDLLYGDISVVNDKNAPIPWVKKYPHKLNLRFLEADTLNHQAAVIKSELFRKFGCYPLEYRIAADYWLFITAFINLKQFQHVGFTMVDYDFTGVSTNNYSKYLLEKQIIWNKVVPTYVREILAESDNHLEKLAQYRRTLDFGLVKVAVSANKVYQRLKLTKR